MIELDENVQVVQDLYTAFGRGDIPGVLSLLAEAIDWHFNGHAEDVPCVDKWR